MSTIGPVALDLSLVLSPSRIWEGGPSSNCWTMRYVTAVSDWELDGGNGLVLYRLGSTFDCNGPNTFSILIRDQTGQAPPSITLWPFSQVPCNCPSVLGPSVIVCSLTPFTPYMHAPGLGPEPLTLRLSLSSLSTGDYLGPCGLVLFLEPMPPAIDSHLGTDPLTLVLFANHCEIHEDVSVDPLTLVLFVNHCEISEGAGVSPLTLTLTTLPPAVGAHLAPSPLTLTLTPDGPGVVEDIGTDPLTLVLFVNHCEIRQGAGASPLTLTLTPFLPAVAAHLAPSPLTLTLTPLPFGPGIADDIGTDPLTLVLFVNHCEIREGGGTSSLTLTLTPDEPTISQASEDVTTSCCLSNPIPATLGMTLSGPCAAVNGTYPIVYSTTVSTYVYGVRPGWEFSGTLTDGHAGRILFFCMDGFWYLQFFYDGSIVSAEFFGFGFVCATATGSHSMFIGTPCGNSALFSVAP